MISATLKITKHSLFCCFHLCILPLSFIYAYYYSTLHMTFKYLHPIYFLKNFHRSEHLCKNLMYERTKIRKKITQCIKEESANIHFYVCSSF